MADNLLERYKKLVQQKNKKNVEKKEIDLKQIKTAQVNKLQNKNSKESNFVMNKPVITDKVKELKDIKTAKINNQFETREIKQIEKDLKIIKTDDIKEFVFKSDKKIGIINKFEFVSDKVGKQPEPMPLPEKKVGTIPDKFEFISNKSVSLNTLQTDNIRQLLFRNDKIKLLKNTKTDNIKELLFRNDKIKLLKNTKTDDIKKLLFKNDKVKLLKSIKTDDITLLKFNNKLKLDQLKNIDSSKLAVVDNIRNFWANGFTTWQTSSDFNIGVIKKYGFSDFIFESDKKPSNLAKLFPNKGGKEAEPAKLFPNKGGKQGKQKVDFPNKGGKKPSNLAKLFPNKGGKEAKQAIPFPNKGGKKAKQKVDFPNRGGKKSIELKIHQNSNEYYNGFQKSMINTGRKNTEKLANLKIHNTNNEYYIGFNDWMTIKESGYKNTEKLANLKIHENLKSYKWKTGFQDNWELKSTVLPQYKGTTHFDISKVKDSANLKIHQNLPEYIYKTGFFDNWGTLYNKDISQITSYGTSQFIIGKIPSIWEANPYRGKLYSKVINTKKVWYSDGHNSDPGLRIYPEFEHFYSYKFSDQKYISRHKKWLFDPKIKLLGAKEDKDLMKQFSELTVHNTPKIYKFKTGFTKWQSNPPGLRESNGSDHNIDINSETYVLPFAKKDIERSDFIVSKIPSLDKNRTLDDMYKNILISRAEPYADNITQYYAIDSSGGLSLDKVKGFASSIVGALPGVAGIKNFIGAAKGLISGLLGDNPAANMRGRMTKLVINRVDNPYGRYGIKSKSFADKLFESALNTTGLIGLGEAKKQVGNLLKSNNSLSQIGTQVGSFMQSASKQIGNFAGGALPVSAYNNAYWNSSDRIGMTPSELVGIAFYGPASKYLSIEKSQQISMNSKLPVIQQQEYSELVNRFNITSAKNQDVGHFVNDKFKPGIRPTSNNIGLSLLPSMWKMGKIDKLGRIQKAINVRVKKALAEYSKLEPKKIYGEVKNETIKVEQVIETRVEKDWKVTQEEVIQYEIANPGFSYFNEGIGENKWLITDKLNADGIPTIWERNEKTVKLIDKEITTRSDRNLDYLEASIIGAAKENDELKINNFFEIKDIEKYVDKNVADYEYKLKNGISSVNEHYSLIKQRAENQEYWTENLYGKYARSSRGMGDGKLDATGEDINSKRFNITETGYEESKTEDFDVKTRYDSINVVGPVKLNQRTKQDPVRESDLSSIKPFSDDFIQFRIYDVVNDIALPFRATLKDYNDNFSAEYSSFQYIGRPDQVYVYKGVSRSTSFSFKVSIGSPIELEPTWQKINYLAGLCFPADYNSKGSGMVGPLTKITIGDLIPGYYAIIKSVGITPEMTFGWGTGDQRQLPRMVDIKMDVQFLHTSQDLPRTISPHFGDLSILRLNDIDDIRKKAGAFIPQTSDYFSKIWADYDRLEVSEFSEDAINFEGQKMGDKYQIMSRISKWNEIQNKMDLDTDTKEAVIEKNKNKIPEQEARNAEQEIALINGNTEAAGLPKMETQYINQPSKTEINNKISKAELKKEKKFQADLAKFKTHIIDKVNDLLQNQGDPSKFEDLQAVVVYGIKIFETDFSNKIWNKRKIPLDWLTLQISSNTIKIKTLLDLAAIMTTGAFSFTELKNNRSNYYEKYNECEKVFNRKYPEKPTDPGYLLLGFKKWPEHDPGKLT